MQKRMSVFANNCKQIIINPYFNHLLFMKPFIDDYFLLEIIEVIDTIGYRCCKRQYSLTKDT